MYVTFPSLVDHHFQFPLGFRPGTKEIQLFSLDKIPSKFVSVAIFVPVAMITVSLSQTDILQDHEAIFKALIGIDQFTPAYSHCKTIGNIVAKAKMPKINVEK